MKCKKAMDLIYYHYGEALPLLVHIRTAFHLFLCPDCAKKNDLLEKSRIIFNNDFLPSAPGLEESIMSKVSTEESAVQETEKPVFPRILSTRVWVIAGFVILISLTSAFFGLEYNKIANSAGDSFIVPLGITIGIVLTCYGALFIGSRLKDFSKRFGLE